MAKNEKRERILDAAFKLFLSKGLTETKMIDIAEVAGIGKGTIYEYFSSKDQLFEVLFEHKVFCPYRELSSVLAAKKTAKEKLMAFVNFDSSLMEEMKISGVFLNHAHPKSQCESTSTLVKCVQELMSYRFSQLHQLFIQGAKEGEFKITDPLISAVAVMGSISFYLSFKYDFLPHTPLIACDSEKSWNDEDLVQLLLQGLCNSA